MAIRSSTFAKDFFLLLSTEDNHFTFLVIFDIMSLKSHLEIVLKENFCECKIVRIAKIVIVGYLKHCSNFGPIQSFEKEALDLDHCIGSVA